MSCRAFIASDANVTLSDHDRRVPAGGDAGGQDRHGRRVSGGSQALLPAEHRLRLAGHPELDRPLKHHYRGEELPGREVVCVFNLPPRRIAGFESQVLVLAAVEAAGGLRLISPGPEAELGSPVT